MFQPFKSTLQEMIPTAEDAHSGFLAKYIISQSGSIFFPIPSFSYTIESQPDDDDVDDADDDADDADDEEDDDDDVSRA